MNGFRRVAIVACVLPVVGCGLGYPEEPITDASNDELENSPSVVEAVITADSTTEWVHWTFTEGKIIQIADAASSNDWDLAVRRTQLATNSGTSGAGSGGALDMEVSDWDAVGDCPAEGYVEDSMLPLPGPPGSGEFSGNPTLNDWFDYDPVSHAVSSKGQVYCVRLSGQAGSGKLQIVNYASGQLTVKSLFLP